MRVKASEVAVPAVMSGTGVPPVRRRQRRRLRLTHVKKHNKPRANINDNEAAARDIILSAMVADTLSARDREVDNADENGGDGSEDWSEEDDCSEAAEGNDVDQALKYYPAGKADIINSMTNTAGGSDGRRGRPNGSGRRGPGDSNHEDRDQGNGSKAGSDSDEDLTGGGGAEERSRQGGSHRSGGPVAEGSAGKAERQPRLVGVAQPKLVVLLPPPGAEAVSIGRAAGHPTDGFFVDQQRQKDQQRVSRRHLKLAWCPERAQWRAWDLSKQGAFVARPGRGTSPIRLQLPKEEVAPSTACVPAGQVRV